MFHDVENTFAGVVLLKAIGVGKFAVLKYIGESDSRRHVMGDNFENTADNVALNHDDESRVVLPGNVTQVDGVRNDLFFSASDSHKWAFISEFDERSKLTVD